MPAKSLPLDATEASPNRALLDLSERADGPPLIAVWGSEKTDSEFQLGTRETGWHLHLRGQIFCIENGLVHVRTRQGSWLLPPYRAGWVPPGMPHMASISGVMSGWNVLVTPEAARGLPGEPCVVGVSEVMRALVRRAAGWSWQDRLTAAQRRVTAVLLDELRAAPHEPLHLPMPTDRRLLRIAHAVLKAPGDARTLDAWADWAGLSPRSLTRLCQSELGMSFAQWRQQAGLVHALEDLARGQSVASVADALGYATPSNFIAMFRRAFGESPARYFAKRGDGAVEMLRNKPA
jgi:AraC-like DNA-binding protein